MLVRLDRTSRIPFYEQIAQQIRALILSGGLLQGSLLPPSRSLAQALGINRKTVTRAYHLLWSEGLIEGDRRSGTRVCQGPELRPKAMEAQSRPWHPVLRDKIDPFYGLSDSFYRRHFYPRSQDAETIGFLHESTANRWGDPDDLRAAFEQSLSSARENGFPLEAMHGVPPLRKLLAKRARFLGLATHWTRIVVTTGRQKNIFLLALTLLRFGDVVAVELPSYAGTIHALQMVGARIKGIPLDEDGIDLDILEGVLSRQDVKLICVAPTFRDPTGTTMSLDRRKDLLDLAHRYSTPIFEDDAYRFLQYEGDAPPPLAALDPYGHTIYASTLKYELPMGLQIGWMAAPSSIVKLLMPVHQAAELNTYSMSQDLALRLLEGGSESREAIRSMGKCQWQAMIDALEMRCAGMLSFIRPQGGASIWAEFAEGIDSAEAFPRMRNQGVLCLPGRLFYPEFSGGERNLRLDFFGVEPASIEEGDRRMAEAVSDLQGGTG